MNNFFVVRFNLSEHKCNPFSFDVKWQVQREKFIKEGTSAFFHPIANSTKMGLEKS